jgi:hypothetical protein
MRHGRLIYDFLENRLSGLEFVVDVVFFLYECANGYDELFLQKISIFPDFQSGRQQLGFGKGNTHALCNSKRKRNIIHVLCLGASKFEYESDELIVVGEHFVDRMNF